MTAAPDEHEEHPAVVVQAQLSSAGTAIPAQPGPEPGDDEKPEG